MISLSLLVNDLLGLLERLLVMLLFAVLVLLKVEFNHVNVNSGFEYLRLLALKESVELTEALVGRESFRLNFVFISLFVEGEAVAGDRSVNRGSEVRVLLDDVTLLILELHVLSSFVHLSQDLDSLALNFSKSAFFVLSLSKTDLFGSLSMLLFSFLLTLDESRLE